MAKILVTGAAGQIGTELTIALRAKFGTEEVIATDIHQPLNSPILDGPFFLLDSMNRQAMQLLVQQHKVKQIYHLVAIISATGEKYPMKGWDLNMQTLLNVLEIAREEKLERIFWPSSIAVYGSNAQKLLCPQTEIQQPETVYGISKAAGEQWCNYYCKKYNLDIRSLRYPGLISYKSAPGGGTTDYAVDMYRRAAFHMHYTCYLQEDTALPMMYMDDAIRGTLELMEAPQHKIKIRTSYNIGAISFTPKQLLESIKQHQPNFDVSYEPDLRQSIANSWPQSIDDTAARNDWGWQPQFNLEAMTKEMLTQLGKYAICEHEME